jgi:pimeloyl-ACP methyl ester carboxylesterase
MNMPLPESYDRRFVTSPDGTRLAVQQWGNPKGAPIILLHAFGMGQWAWRWQVGSHLAERYRFITLDHRGHGESDRPMSAEHYADGMFFAADIATVIQELRLERPGVVAWSMSGALLGDYLAVYGDTNLSAIALIGAAHALGEPLMTTGQLGSIFANPLAMAIHDPGTADRPYRTRIVGADSSLQLAASHRGPQRDSDAPGRSSGDLSGHTGPFANYPCGKRPHCLHCRNRAPTDSPPRCGCTSPPRCRARSPLGKCLSNKRSIGAVFPGRSTPLSQIDFPASFPKPSLLSVAATASFCSTSSDAPTAPRLLRAHRIAALPTRAPRYPGVSSRSPWGEMALPVVSLSWGFGDSTLGAVAADTLETLEASGDCVPKPRVHSVASGSVPALPSVP